MAWFLLLIAGICEIAWAYGLKISEGLTKLWPSIWTIVAMGLSCIFLGWSLKELPLGTAYAIWTGIGAVGTAILGILFFGESTELWRLFSIGLILLGIIGLKLVT